MSMRFTTPVEPTSAIYELLEDDTGDLNYYAKPVLAFAFDTQTGEASVIHNWHVTGRAEQEDIGKPLDVVPDWSLRDALTNLVSENCTCAVAATGERGLKTERVDGYCLSTLMRHTSSCERMKG